MMKFPILLLAAFISTAAAAQDFPSEPYEFILAKLAGNEGRFEEALSRIEKVIEKQPNDPILRFERALLLVDASRMDKAAAELKTITASHPDFHDAQKMLGRLLLDRAGDDKGKLEEALVHLQAAYRTNADDLASGVTAAQILISMNKPAEAEKILGTLVERTPDHRGINYSYAQVLTRVGRGNESKKYLERAVAVDPMFGPAVQQLLDFYQREGEWQKAAAILQPMVDDEPLNIELQRQQAYFFLRAGQPEQARKAFKALTETDPKDLRSQFYLAEAMSDLEQYGEAAAIYKKLLATNPADAEVLASYGLALTGQKKWDEATMAFNSLLAIPNSADNLTTLARTQLAYIELMRGNYDAAVESAKHVFVFRDKPNTQAVNIAMDALRRQKKYAQALELLQPLVEKYGNEPFITARYVEMLARTGDKTKAQTAAASQAKLGPRNTIAAAEAFIQAEDYPSAIAIIREAVKASPDDVDLRFSLGSTLERSGDRKGAEEAFQAVLAKSPEHAPTLNYLGYMWAESNQNLDRAQEMLLRAVGQEPRNGAYIDSLGWVYYRQGNFELAEKYLTDAAHLLPKDATVQEHLADVLAKRGQPQRALAVYRSALALEPTPDEEAKIRSKIAELERTSPNKQQ
jgi:predicted Zn-dependent protease